MMDSVRIAALFFFKHGRIGRVAGDGCNLGRPSLEFIVGVSVACLHRGFSGVLGHGAYSNLATLEYCTPVLERDGVLKLQVALVEGNHIIPVVFHAIIGGITLLLVLRLGAVQEAFFIFEPRFVFVDSIVCGNEFRRVSLIDRVAVHMVVVRRNSVAVLVLLATVLQDQVAEIVITVRNKGIFVFCQAIARVVVFDRPGNDAGDLQPVILTADLQEVEQILLLEPGFFVQCDMIVRVVAGMLSIFVSL